MHYGLTDDSQFHFHTNPTNESASCNLLLFAPLSICIMITVGREMQSEILDVALFYLLNTQFILAVYMYLH